MNVSWKNAINLVSVCNSHTVSQTYCVSERERGGGRGLKIRQRVREFAWWLHGDVSFIVWPKEHATRMEGGGRALPQVSSEVVGRPAW